MILGVHSGVVSVRMRMTSLTQGRTVMFRRLVSLLLLGFLVMSGLAAPPQPPAPETYTALVRYEIFAYRSERVRQYQEMLKALEDAGFKRDPDEVVADDEPDNPKATRMQGTLPSKNVDRLL